MYSYFANYAAHYYGTSKLLVSSPTAKSRIYCHQQPSTQSYYDKVYDIYLSSCTLF